MGWPGGCSTRLLANIVIFSSHLILLISKHFTDCLGTEQSLFFRGSCILISICKQCIAMLQKDFFFLFPFCNIATKAKAEEALKITEGSGQENEGMAVIFKGQRSPAFGYNQQIWNITAVCELQRGNSRTTRQDHQLVFNFKRLHIALKIKWGPLGADSEKQKPFQIQKNQGSLLNS